MVNSEELNVKKRYYKWIALGLGIGVVAMLGTYAWEKRTQIETIPPVSQAGSSPQAMESKNAKSSPNVEAIPAVELDEKEQLWGKMAYSEAEIARHKSLLTQAALKGLTERQVGVWRSGLAKILPEYLETERWNIASSALRDYEHVVFHSTERHNLVRNHEVVRRISSIVEKKCALYEVPTSIVEAIMSWENSGSIDSVSYAGAVGVCQMMEGTVEFVHDYAHREAEALRREAEELRHSEGEGARQRIDEMLAQADEMDCAVRHKTMAKQAGCEERLVIECNVEDAVIYVRYLLEQYEGRIDLAISAYHAGIANIDDVVATYIEAKEGSLKRSDSRQELRQAINRLDIRYADLWNFEKTRAMLGGVRTVDGKITVSENAHRAIGDESDLYLWKVLYSWLAYNEGGTFTEELVKRHEDIREVCAYRDLPVFDSYESMVGAKEEGELVDLRRYVPNGGKSILVNKGIDYLIKLGSGGIKPYPVNDKKLTEASWWVRPELVGYLIDLEKRWKAELRNDKVRLPVGTLSGCLSAKREEVLSGDPNLRLATVCPEKREFSHARGVSVDIDYNGLPDGQRKSLRRLITSDYVFDKIYVSNADGCAHIVLNPRWGDKWLDVLKLNK